MQKTYQTVLSPEKDIKRWDKMGLRPKDKATVNDTLYTMAFFDIEESLLHTLFNSRGGILPQHFQLA